MSEQLEQPPLSFESRQAYYDWASRQEQGRTELLDGRVVSMSPERSIHVRAKQRAWRALDDAVRSAGAPCEALADGMSVEIGAGSAYEPDALVNCGETIADDMCHAPCPVIVVEVTSPSNSRIDLITKTAGYLRHATIRHYLIVLLKQRQVLHHRKLDDGRIETAILTEGMLQLDPPGITISVAELLG